MLNLKTLKFIFFLFGTLILLACQKSSLSTTTQPLFIPSITLNLLQSDADEDYIPDRQDSHPFDPDTNNNAILDGLESDPFFKYQWYLSSTESLNICTTTLVETVEGNDLHILPLYHYTLGNNNGTQTVQVVDGGVDVHPDILLDNNRSINSITHTNDPTPVEGFSTNPVQIFYRGHGTAVAGIIGAIGFNNIGIRGVAPTVKIAGSNWLESEDLAELEKVWCEDNNITISNNSWGSKFINDLSYEALLQKASQSLRDGKGRIFVFAGGNEREDFSNANLSYLINNPYVIAVSAINHLDRYASYSTAGSNIFVSAYGGEHYYTAPTLFTTFTPTYAMSADELGSKKGAITLEEDTERNYTYAMNGSSGSAPMVSGALALVLDMCPTLSWRDIRLLIAMSATPIDINQSQWITNGAGVSHNNNYGFGRINPMGMVEICLSPEYHPLPLQTTIHIENSYDDTIPDTNQSLEKRLFISQDLQIDWVGITLTIDHPYAGDIAIDLISPSGTISHIMDANFLTFNAYQEGFRFSTVSLMGEKSAGEWRILIRDTLKEDTGRLKAIKLEIKGYTL